MMILLICADDPTDIAYARELRQHLAPLRRAHELTILLHPVADGARMASMEWVPDLVLVLVTAATRLWYDESAAALGAALVLPVRLRSCDLTGSHLGRLVALPRAGRAVAERALRDEAWVEVAVNVRELLARRPA
jgi:hypothetical protein